MGKVEKIQEILKASSHCILSLRVLQPVISTSHYNQLIESLTEDCFFFNEGKDLYVFFLFLFLFLKSPERKTAQVVY